MARVANFDDKTFELSSQRIKLKKSISENKAQSADSALLSPVLKNLSLAVLRALSK
jgi:hypothetical protein